MHICGHQSTGDNNNHGMAIVTNLGLPVCNCQYVHAVSKVMDTDALKKSLQCLTMASLPAIYAVRQSYECAIEIQCCDHDHPNNHNNNA